MAVDHLNLEITSGELIALLGPSGCGKTTTLRMLAGFVRPDAGKILVNQQVFSSRGKTIPPEQRQMSMIFQSYAIWPHKTVFENVAFGLRLRRINREELLKRVHRVLEMTHLSQLGDRYPAQLSGGQQQRVALARALAIEPQILLLDEPLSNLDASLREEMRQEIRRIHNHTGLTTIYVTHDQAEALVLADRIAVMHAGTLQQVGTPEEIYQSPATEFVARFIGRCNVLPGKLLSYDRVDVGGVAIVATDRAREVMGQEVALCIRPHAIIVQSYRSQTTHSGKNSFTAWIEQHSYFGEFREYKVCLEEKTVRLNVVTPPTTIYHVGDRVHLILPPEHCRIVPCGSKVFAAVRQPMELHSKLNSVPD